MKHSFLPLLFTATIAALTLHSQESRGALTGTVSDPTGAAVPGAQVIAKHLGTNVESKTQTNEAGLYVVPFLNTGTYSITVSAGGFKTITQTGVEVSINQRLQLDFILEVGSLAEQVTVSASAELLNTTNAVRSTTLNTQQVADLPLLGKNPYALSYHALGIQHINPQGSITDRPYDNGGMDAISVNGGRAFTNEYLLDGAPNTNTERSRPNSLSFVPPPEATEEVNVMSNNYDAQYGRTGGGVIAATLKSGTNQLHGAIYEYFRNEKLNANTWQANRQGLPRAPFRWNQPGVTINGPVYIPKLYDGRNRTFFLASWEGIYQNIPNNPLQTVPSLQQRNGDFSNLRTAAGQPIVIYDPLTTRLAGNTYVRDPFPGNSIPAERIDPVARRILQYIPEPNFPADANGLNNYSPRSGLVTRERYNAFTTKIDQILTPNHRLAFTWVRNNRWQTGPDFGWKSPVLGPNNFQRKNLGSGLQATSTLSPTLVLTTRFGVTQHTFANYMFGGSFDPAALGFPASQVSQAQGQFFPVIGMTNYTGLGQGGNNADISTNWYLTSSAVKVVEKHSVKFGGEVRVLFDNLPNYSFATFNFTPLWTQANPIAASNLAGNAFASFLLGYANDTSSSNYNATPAWGSRYYGLYIQDDWRITRKLTINIGGRWDYDSPWTERYNRMNAGFGLTSASPIKAPGLDLKGGLLFTSPGNRLPYKRDLNNFQPRLGMAWQFAQKSVFRAGYGMSYVPSFVFNNTTAVIGTQGFSTSTPFVVSTDNNITPANVFSNPFPQGILPPTGASAGLATQAGQNITYVYPNRVTPYIQQYSAGFQHELPWRILVDASYVGSQTRELGAGKNINALTTDQLALGTVYLNQSVPNPMQGLLPGSAFNGPTIPRRQLLLPYPQFASVNRNELPVGRGWYNALQIQAQKRLTHGFQITMNYTWSATMEASSYLNPQFSDGQLERARTAEDLPHRMSIFGIWQLPSLPGANTLVRGVLGGWQFNGIAIFQSGRQLNGVDAYSTGVNPFVPGPQTPDGYYFNACSLNLAGQRQNCASPDQPAAWVQRPADTLRVAGSRWSQLREPRPPLLDSSIFKSFRPVERVNVQFRAEMFNTFNTPWFGQANTTFGNARFGLLGNTQTNDQRNLQLALKLTF